MMDDTPHPPGPALALPANPSSGERFAAELRGFGPVGIAAMAMVLASSSIFWPLKVLAVPAWALASRTPWRELGFVRPRSRLGMLAGGVVLGGVFKLAMKALVMPLLGTPAINPAFHFLAGNTAAALVMVPVLVFGAGFGEEALFRGYLFERLGKLLGSSPAARTAIVLLTSALFAATHYPGQGIAGVEQAAVTGLVFGTIFAATGRIWTVMCAHAAFDLVALAIIYFDLETTVAHLVFR